MPNYQFLTGIRTAFPADATSGPQVLEESDASIRYGGGTWTPFSTAAASGGAIRYSESGWYEITVPAGITRVVFGGFRNSEGGFFQALKNGVEVSNGSQYAATPDQATYAEFLNVQAGDVLRLQKSGGTLVFADSITLYP